MTKPPPPSPLYQDFSPHMLICNTEMDFRFHTGFEKRTSEILEEEGPRNSNQVSKYLLDEL